MKSYFASRNWVRSGSIGETVTLFPRCLVGVLGPSAPGPEYEQLEPVFIRGEDGSVVLEPYYDLFPMN